VDLSEAFASFSWGVLEYRYFAARDFAAKAAQMLLTTCSRCVCVCYYRLSGPLDGFGALKMRDMNRRMVHDTFVYRYRY
jgi:hypothetical protein